MRIRPVQWLTALSALVFVAACERSSPAKPDLSNRSADSAPRLEGARDASSATQDPSKEGVSVHSDSKEAAASDNWQPPARGSKLSPEEAHRLLSGTIQFNPGSIQSSGIPVGQDTPLLIGQDLQVKYGGTWWAASIVGLEPDGRVRIHYFGWADSYDEVKSRAELQLDPDVRLRALDGSFVRDGRPPASLTSYDEIKGRVELQLDPDARLLDVEPVFPARSGSPSWTPKDASRLLTGTVQFNPGSIASSNIPVQPYTPLSVGQDLQVKYGNTWWAASIVGFEPDGRVRIHYFGWADSYDEVRPRTDLQLDPQARARAVNAAVARSGQ
jgi:hypothetical protein